MNVYRVDRGCKSCEACCWACPAGAIGMEADGAHIDQGKCVHCGVCYANCPCEAISVHEETATHDGRPHNKEKE